MTTLATHPRVAASLPYHRFILATALDGALARATLSPQESAICDCLPGSERKGYRAARLAVRRALWQLEEDHRGAVPLREPALSVTHRNGRAVAVSAPGPARLGVALARRPGRMPGYGRLALTPTELGLSICDAAVVHALKRAAWEALELPEELSFHELELRRSAAGRLVAVQVGQEMVPAAAAFALPWPGFVAAAVRVEAAR